MPAGVSGPLLGSLASLADSWGGWRLASFSANAIHFLKVIEEMKYCNLIATF